MKRTHVKDLMRSVAETLPRSTLVNIGRRGFEVAARTPYGLVVFGVACIGAGLVWAARDR